MKCKSAGAAMCAVAWAATSQAQPLDDPIPDPIVKGTIAIELELVADGLAAPNLVTHAGDGSGRKFIVDQAGTVRVLNAADTLLPTPFLDVSGRLVSLGVFGSQDPFTDFDERGLLGLAFHPDFGRPGTAGFGRFYTYTSEPSDGAADFTVPIPPDRQFNHQAVVSEWRVDQSDPNRADPNSRRELMRIDEPQFNHNAGMIAFGPDGHLYIGLGDGGGADDTDGQDFFGEPIVGHGPDGNGQNTDNVLGDILRIDPLGNGSPNGQYGIPVDNPFVGVPGVDEIYASGFRNPFRFSFDRTTGDLWVGDVGQNDIEEVDRVSLGGNFGWKLKEGTFKFNDNGDLEGFVEEDDGSLPPGLIDPIGQYDHDEGISTIGGFIYRGSAIPELVGMYVFGDFSRAFFAPQGRLFAMDPVTGTITELVLGLDDRELGLFIKGFGEDENGELYLEAGVNLGPFGDFGQVFRIVSVPAVDTLSLVVLAGLGWSRRRRPHE
ncbi:MAG: PQQ-dependent sugar dehydrogenase [Phycisphaeraceae bacterium]|nr:PQQ-dependent sugar dehydrogenase [Phycisphaeraceae bacterium]